MIFIGVDGTGSASAAAYFRETWDSFVRRCWQRANTGESDKQYFRGPTWSGTETDEIGRDVYRFVRKRWPHHRKTPALVLAGFSRGGAAIIHAAQLLRNPKAKDQATLGRGPVSVDLMILFDAVDRSTAVDGTTIPDNVKTVYYVQRDPLSWSRESFGNCGLSYSREKTTFTKRQFKTTHGGAGGCPHVYTDAYGGNPDAFIWEKGDGYTIRFGEDLKGSKEAWAWIEPILTKAGVLK